MTAQQTQDLIQGTYSAADNAVTGFLQIQSYKRRVNAISLTGPANSTFSMYRGDRINPAALIPGSRTQFGDAGTYDSVLDGSPMLIGAGEQALAAWTGGSVAPGATGQATIYSQVG